MRLIRYLLLCSLTIGLASPPAMAFDDQIERKRLALIVLELDRIIRESRKLAREVGAGDSRLRMVYRDLKAPDGRIWRAGLVDDLIRIREAVAGFIEQQVDLLDDSRALGQSYTRHMPTRQKQPEVQKER